jgi:hypothetical protein
MHSSLELLESALRSLAPPPIEKVVKLAQTMQVGPACIPAGIQPAVKACEWPESAQPLGQLGVPPTLPL